MSMGMTSAPATMPAAPVRSWKLLATLGGAGALAGLLIVTTYLRTLPGIEANKGRVLEAAIGEVLAGPARFDTLYLSGGRLTKTPAASEDRRKLERVYLGRRADGSRIGFAIPAGEPGFADMVEVLFGYDASAHRVLAMKVVASKETPGLGDRIVKDTNFSREFDGVTSPLVGAKKGQDKGAPNEVVMITGATISSRTVIRIINDAVGHWQPLLDAYRDEATP